MKTTIINLPQTYSVLTIGAFIKVAANNFKIAKTNRYRINLEIDNFRTQHILRAKPELTGALAEATDIRLIGTYESMEEAEFISGKVNKEIKHSNEKIYEECAQSDYDPSDLIDDTTTMISCLNFKPSCKYTNGVSNVQHHLDNLKDMRNNRLENTISLISKTTNNISESFINFINKQEGRVA